MISPSDIDALRANPRFLVRELVARGVEVELVDFQQQVFRATYRGRTEHLVDIDSSIVPLPMAAIANDKFLAKRTMQSAGISVPEGNRFLYAQLNAALLYAMELGFPVVVKPIAGRQGRGVEAHLANIGEVEAAIDRIGEPMFVLEKQAIGEELRVLITKRGAWACAARRPASVIGDGERTIAELCEAETRRRTSPRTNCLGPVTPDARFLQKCGRDLDTIPRTRELVFVRGCVDAEGASVTDVTDEVHESIVALAARVLAAFDGLPYLGIDLVSLDPRAPQTEDSYRVLEVNPNPALGLHIAPGAGKSRNMAGAIADLIFPETAA